MYQKKIPKKRRERWETPPPRPGKAPRYMLPGKIWGKACGKRRGKDGNSTGKGNASNHMALWHDNALWNQAPGLDRERLRSESSVTLATCRLVGFSAPPRPGKTPWRITSKGCDMQHDGNKRPASTGKGSMTNQMPHLLRVAMYLQGSAMGSNPFAHPSIPRPLYYRSYLANS